MNHRNNTKLNKVEQLFQQAFSAHQAGKLEEAKSLYLRVLRSMPADMESLYLLGTAYSQTEHFEQAKKYLMMALKLSPNHVESLNNMGLTLKGLGQPKEALTYYQRALKLRPDYADGHSNMGNALEFLGELDQAETHLRRALELDPNHADAYCNLGLVLNGKDRFEEAVQCILRGLQLRPDHAISYDYLGSIYKIWGRFDEALACLDKAVMLSPNTYSPRNNRGAILEELGRYDEALLEYQRAAEIEPDDAAPRWNQAYLFLRQGILDRGWEAHELRLQNGGQVSIRFPYPEWDGSPLEGKTVLIYAEQGLGDEILFASCIPDVIARAGHCIIECAPRLDALFKRSFPGATVVGSPRMEVGWLLDMPKIDVQVAAGSLPRFLRPTIDSFPQHSAYLSAELQRAEHWRARVALLGPGLKVGICWRSGLAKGERQKFYSDLTQWGEIFKIPGVHFVNLQYGECAEELREAQEKFGVPITVFEDIDLREQIDESAALMASMDLVISAATAVAEIAGAQGIETYRLDFYGKQWVALGCTDFMPWHPNTKLIEQTSAGDWDTQLAVVAEALKEKVAGHASEVAYVLLPAGVDVAVNGSLEDLPHYVLKEQQKWFDPEFDFVLALAQPGMRIVDVGAGVGAYALPLAKKIGGGRLYAITQNAAETNLLMKSRMRNGLEKSLNIVIADQKSSLDSQMDHHGLDGVALVRLAADICNADLLDGGTRFFSVNSPLIMFGIGAGEHFDTAVAQWLIAHGFGLFRLVPGLGLLVPCTSTDELDVYAVNLFACKPDCAGQLERQGVLIRQPHTLTSLPGIDLRHWQEYLGARPYAAELLDGWISSQQKEKDWEVYWMALNLFAMSKSESRAGAERYACLQAANGVLSSLVQEQANLPRLLSLCRVLNELGKREMTVSVLNQMCDLLHAGMSTSLNEPCLALTEWFASIIPGERTSDWAVAMVLAQRENLRAFSTYFTGQESLPVLEEVKAIGFGGDDVESKIMLIKSRFGVA